MTEHIHRPLLEEFQKFLRNNMGLSFSLNHEREVSRKISAIACEFGFTDPSQCLIWLTNHEPTRQDMEKLALHLSVGETFFFREPKSFDYLEKIYLPELIRDRSSSGRTLRVWSAGVASGEEIYSLAILLRKMIPHLPGWKILLLGTDINQQLLEKARNGIYSKWSFRNRKYSPEEYFTSTSDQRFRISETIRDMVTLGWLNLAEPVYPSPLNNTCDLDIIFCRNVMIYFTPEMISQVTERFFSCLAKGGILIVSPADMTPYIYEKFSRTVYQGYTIYHKSRVSTEQKERQLPGFMAEMQEILLPFPEPIPAPRPESPLTDFFEHHIPSVPAETEQSIAHTETVSLKEISVADIRRLADEGKYHEGAALCQEALRLKRSDHLLHFLLGTIYTEMGMTDQAVESFKKVIYLEKDFIMAHYLLAKLLMEKGEAQQSVKVRKILIRLLSGLPSAAVVPESGDFTAGQFLGLVQSELSYRN